MPPSRTDRQGVQVGRRVRKTSRHRRWRFVVFAGLSAILASFSTTAGQTDSTDVELHRPRVLVARIEGTTISPVTARFIHQSIVRAEEEQAECLVIMLDTPGGLVSSTREIVKDMLASRTCIVVYVAPTGSEAASAGGFITLASHVAAMAPTTTIGAMRPVSIGSLPVGPQPPDSESQPTDDQPHADSPSRATSTYEEKVVNNTVAWARGLAARHGRNAEWAAQTVSESVVATDEEALEQGVVEIVAVDVADLLRQLEGRTVTLVDQTVTLQTADAEIQPLEMWWGDRLLATIADPNVAFVLLIFGFYGILFEFYSPGWGVAGTLGIICLLLAFFGLSVLPINYTGLLLIAAALALFVAEVFVTSYGALALGGIACLMMGALMLVDSPAGFARVSLAVVVPVAAATAAITIFLVGTIVRVHRRKVATGGEAMLGSEAVAVEEFTPQDAVFRGTVQVHGEFWNAVSSQHVAADEPVRVDRRDGLTLHVTPAGQSR